MLYEAMSALNRLRESAMDDTALVPTGYRAFDSYLKRGGLRRGHVAALLGRSEVGKTMLACNLVSRVVRAGHPVLFSSQEMTVEDVTARLISITYGLPSDVEDRIKAGTLSEQWLDEFQEDFRDLIIWDEKEPNFADLTKQLATFEKLTGKKPSLVVQDYMDLMSQKGMYGGIVERMGGLAREFEKFAKTNEVATVVLAQTGRANEGDSTARNHGHVSLTKEDIRYGGEQAFDVMWGLYRPELDPKLYSSELEGEALMDALERRNYWKDKAVLQTVKNRFGKNSMTVPLSGHEVQLDWSCLRFVEPEEKLEAVA